MELGMKPYLISMTSSSCDTNETEIHNERGEIATHSVGARRHDYLLLLILIPYAIWRKWQLLCHENEIHLSLWESAERHI